MQSQGSRIRPSTPKWKRQEVMGLVRPLSGTEVFGALGLGLGRYSTTKRRLVVSPVPTSRGTTGRGRARRTPANKERGCERRRVH